MSADMKNLHVPLPEGMYSRLRTEAARQRRPATELAREAIDRWLLDAKRAQLNAAIEAYARQVAGTRYDLDEEMERAAVESMVTDADVLDRPKLRARRR